MTATRTRLSEHHEGPPSQELITSIRIIPGPLHETVVVWNRGAQAGSMVVKAGDGARIAERLLPRGYWTTL